MQAEHRQSWKLRIHAKLLKLHIKLKTNKLLLPSSCNSFQFSTKFKIHNLLITLNAKSKASFASKFNSSKSRFLQTIKKLRIRRSTRGISPPKWQRTQVSKNGESSWLGGDLARFRESISRNDRNGIIKFGSIIVMFLGSRLYNYLRRKRLSLLIVLAIGMLISGIRGGYIASYLFKAKAIVPLLECIFTIL